MASRAQMTPQPLKSGGAGGAWCALGAEGRRTRRARLEIGAALPVAAAAARATEVVRAVGLMR